MTPAGTPERIGGSFRDPSGFLFTLDGALYRRVNPAYIPHYDRLMRSGLYDALAGAGLLIPHREVSPACGDAPAGSKLLMPEIVPFISYPYEWCFGQLKDAALATLEIQRIALGHGMTLKDASAYNIQFVAGKPLLIDTLSFACREEGAPWVAYRQFCQHFLAPLALMSRSDVRLGQLLRVYVDGVPLDLASALLPLGSRFRFSLLAHIHLHARVQAACAGRPGKAGGRALPRFGLLALIDNLRAAVERLRWEPRGTEWGGYYGATNYPAGALESKKALVSEFLEIARPRTVWDLGANTGLFSRVAGGKGMETVAMDGDPAAVETNYRQCRRGKETRIHPLLVDLTNPSPSMGWAGEERMSLAARGPADAVMALALVHHLAIANNTPLPEIARFLAGIGKWLVVEFIPKSDSNARRLLSTREDIFPDYAEGPFEAAFGERFTTERKARIPGTERTLYLMRRR